MGEKEKISDKKQVRKKIYSMILPITIENILQMTAGFVSMAMIGRIDAIAIVSLGLSARITQIIWALFKGITTGGVVFVAQAYGSGNSKKVKHVIQQTLLSSIILVFMFQQLVYWKASLLLEIFNPKPDLLANAVIYLKIVSWGLPFMAIMLVVAGVLQATGNAKTPMKIALIMNLTNIVFSFILIFGKLGMPALGIRGAAIATIIAQFTGAILGIYVLFNKSGILYSLLNRKFFKLDLVQISKVYKVGMPTALESIFWQISAIILTRVILSYGEVAMASYQLGLQAESISFMPATGFGVAATAFIGQAVGAKDSMLGRKYMKELLKGSAMITSVSAFILIFFPESVMRLLTNDVKIIKMGVIYLIVMGLVQLPQNIAGVFNGALRGAGYTKVPMIVAGVGIWVIRIPLSLLLTYKFNMTINAIWVVMGLDLVVRFILSLTLYKTRDIYNNELVFEDKQ
ncbi:MATE family efflux transporter [Clostridium tagluense]|uniref:Probable multidrug resistance protein NorM n=1 Tax=Clostridium tagluense TaxID=360422 RepID=A0A401UGK9_9CLOT|nr:MATE family efflux transporter [Clostridium tagluense]GCD08619.1 MATE efflux family protein [Clostridium tagluense]